MLVCDENRLEFSLVPGILVWGMIPFQIEGAVFKIVNLVVLQLVTFPTDLNLMPIFPLTVGVVFSLVLNIEPDAEMHSVIDHHFHIKGML